MKMKTTNQQPEQPEPALNNPRINRWISSRPFEYIAFWQFMTFIMLICLIWVNEIADLTSKIYNTQSTGVDWLGSSLLSAFVIVVGFITVAHTYVQQQRILRGVITICSSCKKIRVDEEFWEQVESFVTDRTLAQFSHGLCPDCYARTYREHFGKEPKNEKEAELSV